MADQAQPNNSDPLHTDDNLARLLVPELEEPFFRSLLQSVKELVNPTKLPPLDVTSKPVEVAATGVDAPFYRSLIQNVKDLVRPPKLPPLEVTSEPVPVKDIWGLYGRQKKSFFMSAGFQVALVTAAFILGSTKPVQMAIKQAALVFLPVDVSPVTPPQNENRLLPGGGGDRSTLPASFGKLPKASLTQYTPPAAVFNNMDPKLAMEPSILAPPDAVLPQVTAANYGDPFSKYTILSNGRGAGGGIGDEGKNGGVGNRNGPGFDEGNGGFGVYRSGVGGVTRPTVLVKKEPEYSEEARKAKVQGTVIVSIVVTPDGRPTQMKIQRSVGLGLDEKALEALAQWRFNPGKKDGKPVPVEASIEVNFRLL
jgi:TonB family protein